MFLIIFIITVHKNISIRNDEIQYHKLINYLKTREHSHEKIINISLSKYNYITIQHKVLIKYLYNF